MSDGPHDLVRVKNPTTGREYTTTRLHATQAGVQILDDKPAVDAFGRHLPPKRRTDLTGQTPDTADPGRDTNPSQEG